MAKGFEELRRLLTSLQLADVGTPFISFISARQVGGAQVLYRASAWFWSPSEPPLPIFLVRTH